MADDLATKLQKFSLSAAERGGVVLLENDITLSKQESERSLFGKSFGSKKVNFQGLKNTLLSIWVTKEVFSVRDLGSNLVQFIFNNEEDKHKILSGKAWCFENQFIILKDGKNGMDVHKEEFHMIDLWVHVWNLPNHRISVDTGVRIGKIFGRASDVHIPESVGPHGRFLKMCVSVNLNNPLIRGTFLKLGDENIWIDFRYENLAGFCCYCGRVGHPEMMCCHRRSDMLSDALREGQFGEWIRAESPGAGKNFSRGVPYRTSSVAPIHKPQPATHQVKTIPITQPRSSNPLPSPIPTNPLNPIYSEPASSHQILEKQYEILPISTEPKSKQDSPIQELIPTKALTMIPIIKEPMPPFDNSHNLQPKPPLNQHCILPLIQPSSVVDLEMGHSSSFLPTPTMLVDRDLTCVPIQICSHRIPFSNISNLQTVGVDEHTLTNIISAQKKWRRNSSKKPVGAPIESEGVLFTKTSGGKRSICLIEECTSEVKQAATNKKKAKISFTQNSSNMEVEVASPDWPHSDQ